MRRFPLLFVYLALSCNQRAEAPPAPPAAPAVDAAQVRHAPKAPLALEEYFKIRRIGSSRGTGDATLSYDEKLVAYSSDAGGRPDIWVQPIAGGPATQITHVSGFLHSYEFSPAADRLAYEADQAGDELAHLYLTDSKGSPPKDLAQGYPAGARTQFVRWADDGKSLLFLGSARDPKYLDLYEYNLAKDKAELLWKSSGRLSFGLPSRDHKRFIVVDTISDVNNNVYLIDREAPQAPRSTERGQADGTLLTAHEGDVLYGPQAFSKDGRTLYLTSDQGGEFTALYTMDLRKKAMQPVLSEPWDVEGGDYSSTWRYFYTVTNVDGTPKLVVTDEKTHKPVALPEPPPGGAWRPVSGTRPFSTSDRYLAVMLQSDTAPRTAYVLDLKEAQAIRTVDPLPDSLRGRPLVTGEVVRVPSFDGKPVPAFVFRPGGAGPFPAVLDIHGGPTGQSQREFGPMRQYLVSKGYVVMVPNVRGSTGYGKSYTKADNLDLGGGPLKDVVACKGWLVKNAKVAPDQVVVMGGSYGGYMALAAATFTPAEFAANVDYFGVSDLKSLVESFPPYWTTSATFIYQKFGDPKNPAHSAYQHDRSPLNYIDAIQRPLLVVQGDKDARVKQDQSDRIVAALRKKKVPVDYLVIKDEGHGFSKNENRLLAYQVTDRFLDRYIFGDTSVVVLPETR